ncbi:hypothetical protein SKAU_G00019010 [Synaphobranchus kaupii]|uniref:Uncharacterized protein n=1 Tax=Synaphobranchus kaupii TaxID=118154 RepID=A0A9Q1GCL4_SYNKA|nr:hypothetical protein SKAU_G00019010 [Synaphobranchus kaupii]
MAKMTFVPVTESHRDAFNSQLFHESNLFCIQSVCTNLGKVVHHDFFKVNYQRRTRLVRVDSITYDSAAQDLVLRCRLLFRGLEMRNHNRFQTRTPLRDQLYISDTVVSIEIDVVVREIDPIEDDKLTGYYRHSDHEATAYREPSTSFIKDVSALPPLCSQGQPRLAFPTGVPVLPLYVHLYFDGFGLYRRKHHSTNGLYFSLGNLPRTEGAKRESIGIVGLGEPEALPRASVEYIGQNACRQIPNVNILLSMYTAMLHSAYLNNKDAKLLQVNIINHHELFVKVQLIAKLDKHVDY